MQELSSGAALSPETPTKSIALFWESSGIEELAQTGVELAEVIARHLPAVLAAPDLPSLAGIAEDEPNLPLVLFHQRADLAIAYCLRDGWAPDEAIEAWARNAESLVAFVRTHRRRVSLIEAGSPAEDILAEFSRIGLDLQDDVEDLPATPQPDPFYHLAAVQLLGDNAAAASLTEELDAMARVVSPAPRRPDIAAVIGGRAEAIAALKRLEVEHKQAVDVHARDLAAAKARAEAAATELQAQKARQLEIEQALENLRQAEETTRAQLSLAQAELGARAEQIQTLESEIEKLAEREVELGEARAVQQATLAQLLEVEEAEEEHRRQLEEVRAELEKRESELRARASELEAVKLDLGMARDALRARDNELKYEDERHRLAEEEQQRQLAEARADIERLTARLTQLQQGLQGSEAEVARLEAAVQSRDEDLRRLTAELDEVRGELASKAELLREERDKAERLRRIEQELSAELGVMSVRLEESVAESERRSEDLRERSAELEEVRGELASKTELLQQERRKSERLSRIELELTTELGVMFRRLEAGAAEAKRQSQQVAMLEAEIRAIRQTISYRVMAPARWLRRLTRMR